MSQVFVKGHVRAGHQVKAYTKTSPTHRLLKKASNKGGYHIRRKRNVARIERAMESALRPGREKRKASLFRRFDIITRY